MSLIRYETAPVSTLLSDLDSIFGETFDWSGRSLSGQLYPNVDITESDTGYKIRADLPGLTREAITVSVEDGVLSISGEKKREVEKSDKDHYCHFERSYGTFRRSFSLPAHVDSANIAAKYADGVLEVNLRKTEEAKPRAIEIKVS
ncbi:MAG: Hsp20/alpha crystallin family protein [Chitinispirillaceae bacterium]|nr:Hsp20/alpha crystallin family protein [Chitinispirillaceae bacterium]